MSQSREWYQHDIRPEAKGIYNAIQNDNLNELEKLIHEDNINAPLDTVDIGVTPLISAVSTQSPNPKIIQFLLSFKECDFDKEIKKNKEALLYTALGTALAKYRKENNQAKKAAFLQCVVLLIEHGANVSHPSVQAELDGLRLDAKDAVRGLIEFFKEYKNLTPTQIKEKGALEDKISRRYRSLGTGFKLTDFFDPIRQHWLEKSYIHGDIGGTYDYAVSLYNRGISLTGHLVNTPESILSMENSFPLWKKETDRQGVITELKFLIAQKPTRALEACLALARIHLGINNLDEANKYFRQAKDSLNPELQVQYYDFLQGLNSLYALNGQPKNVLHAVHIFGRLAPDLKYSHPILSVFAYLLAAQAYYELAVHQKTAAEFAPGTSANTEHMVDSAINMHNEIFLAKGFHSSRYAYSGQRIYLQLFKLSEIANPTQKKKIKGLILKHVRDDDELLSLQTVVRYLPTLIPDHQQLFNEIEFLLLYTSRCAHIKTINASDACLIITECVEQFPETKDSQFNFLKEQALGNFLSDKRDPQSLKAAIQHYESAKKFAAECKEFFPTISFRKAHRHYANAIKNSDPKAAYHHYCAAAELDDVHGALRAANMASQDQEKIFDGTALKLYRQAADLAADKHRTSILKQLKKFKSILAPLPEQLTKANELVRELETKILCVDMSDITTRDHVVLEKLINLYALHADAEFEDIQSIVLAAKRYIEAALAKCETPGEANYVIFATQVFDPLFDKKYPNKFADDLRRELLIFTKNLLRQKADENHLFFGFVLNFNMRKHADGISEEVKITSADEYLSTVREALQYHPLQVGDHDKLRQDIQYLTKATNTINLSDAKAVINLSRHLENRERKRKGFVPSINPAAKPLLIEAYDSAKHYIKTKHTNRALVFCQLTKLLVVDERNHVYANPDEYKQMPIDVDTFEVPISLDADATQNKKEDRYKFYLLARWNQTLVEKILPDLKQNPALPDNAAMLQLLETDLYAFMLQAPGKYAILYGFGDEETPFYRDLIIERITLGLKQGLHVSKKWIQEKLKVKPILSCEKPCLSFAAAVKPLSVVIPSAPEIKSDAVVIDSEVAKPLSIVIPNLPAFNVAPIATKEVIVDRETAINREPVVNAAPTVDREIAVNNETTTIVEEEQPGAIPAPHMTQRGSLAEFFSFFKSAPTTKECDKIGVIVESMTYTTEATKITTQAHTAEVKKQPETQAILNKPTEKQLAELVAAMPAPPARTEELLAELVAAIPAPPERTAEQLANLVAAKTPVSPKRTEQQLVAAIPGASKRLAEKNQTRRVEQDAALSPTGQAMRV